MSKPGTGQRHVEIFAVVCFLCVVMLMVGFILLGGMR
jgi:hypothetical protein